MSYCFHSALPWGFALNEKGQSAVLAADEVLCGL
jgi:hypothetical protein